MINQHLILQGKVSFQNNTAGVFYASDHSTVVFGENSDVAFIQNSAYKGGAALLRNHSNILFDKNSIVTFDNNSATYGIIYSATSSNVTFTANCQVTFSNNSVTLSGAATYIFL